MHRIARAALLAGSLSGALWGSACAQLSPAAIAPDAALAREVCRPTFAIDDRQTQTGTAFLLQAPVYTSKTLLVTAQHLFGLASGPGGGMRWNEMPARAHGVACRSLDKLDDWKTGHAYAIVDAHAVWGVQNLKDVAIFPVTSNPPPSRALELASRAPVIGDPVWLIAETEDPLMAGKFFHRARVVHTLGFLAFAYDDKAISLGNTSGGPIVNAEGHVVGINVGSTKAAGAPDAVIGVADNLDTIESALIDVRGP